MGVSGVTVYTTKLASPIRIDRPSKRHARTDATVQDLFDRHIGKFNVTQMRGSSCRGSIQGQDRRSIHRRIISPYFRLVNTDWSGTADYKWLSKGGNQGASRASGLLPQNITLHHGSCDPPRAVMRLQSSPAPQACPLRRSLPGVAPVHLPSWKVSTPLTMIE